MTRGPIGGYGIEIGHKMATKGKNRYFVWIIMGLLFVGLLGFGTGGLNGTIRSLGSAGEKDISVVEYQRAISTQLDTLSAQFGTPISFAQAQQFGLDQAALSQLVTERTLDNEAAQMGLSVGDERVRQEVLRIPSFRGVDGQFDREAYRFTLDRSGLTEAQFESSIRDEVARTLLQGAVVGGIPAPQTYASALSNYIGEQRSLTWARIDAEMLTAPVAGPTDAQLQTFYDENPDSFTLPESRAITYVWLTPDMIQDDLTVDEDALRALYEERKSEFVQPERRLVERLVYIDQDTAEAAAEQAVEMDTSFDDLVAARGLDLADVDLGDVSIEDLGAAGDIVFAAEVGSIVGPLNTSLGPALFRVNAVLSAEEVTFEDAQADLREELATQRARRVIDDGQDRITDLMAGGARLEDLAEQTDMQLGQIDWTATSADGVAAYEEFRQAAAEIQEGDFADLINLSDGGIMALRLDAITPPVVQPLAEVRDSATDAYMVNATQDAVLAQAERVAADILPLSSFDDLGIAATVETNLTRRSFVGGTPPSFLTEVFDMSVGDVRVVDNGADAIIVRLDAIAAPDPDDAQTGAERETAANVAAAGIAQDIFEAYSAAVQQRTDIDINQAAVNAVHAQLQ